MRNLLLAVAVAVTVVYAQDPTPDPFPRGPNPVYGENITSSMTSAQVDQICRDCIVDPDGMGYVRNAGDCASYHQCQYTGFDTYRWHVFRMNCAFNSRWIDSMVTCMDCRFATCTGTPQEGPAGSSCAPTTPEPVVVTTYTPPSDLGGVNCTGFDGLNRQRSTAEANIFYRGQDGKWRRLSCGNFEWDQNTCSCNAPAFFPLRMTMDENWNAQPNNKVYGNAHQGADIILNDADTAAVCRNGAGCGRFNGTGFINYNLFKNLPLGGAFTIATWFNQDAEARNKQGLWSNGGCNKAPSLSAIIDGSSIRFQIETTANGTQEVTVAIPGRGQWVHVAMTYASGDGMRVYVNGQQAAAIDNLYGSLTRSRQVQHPIVLGKAIFCERDPGQNPGGASTSFEGRMDDFYVTKTAHSASDVAALAA